MNQNAISHCRRVLSKFVLVALIFVAVGVNAGEASAATYSVTPSQNYYFTLTSTTSVVFYTSNNGSGDPYLYLYDSQGTLVTSDDDSQGSLNSRISRTLSSGSYRLLSSYLRYSTYTLNSTISLSTSSTTSTVAPTTSTVLASTLAYSVSQTQNFYFSLASTTSVVFYTSNNGSANPELYLYDLQGTQLAYDYDSQGSMNSRISIALSAGNYRLSADFYGTYGSYTLNSTVSLSTTMPTTTTTVAPTTTTTVAIAVPTVSWASVPSGSVSSSFTVKASATSAVTTATITKWCLTLDGGALASNLSVYDSSYPGVYYYGSFSSSTGCWSSSYTSLTSGAFTINPSAMTNGSHTLALVVYDSRSVASVAASTTFTVGITAPTVSWASVPSGSVSSSFTVKASATSSLTISKWCVTLDGGALASNLSVYDSSYPGVYYYGSFSSSTGCWSSSYTSLTSGAFTINPSAMTNGSHTLALVVYDSRSVASVAASTTFTVGITAPTVSWASVPSGSVSSSFTVKASATSGSSSTTITKWCLTIDGRVPTSNMSVYDSSYSGIYYYGSYSSSTGCWSSSYTSLTSGSFTINPTSLTNGLHSLALVVSDSRSVSSVAASTTFTVGITAPTSKPAAVASPQKKAAAPKKKVVVTLPPKKKAAAIPKVVGMTKNNAVKALQAKKMKAQVKIDSNCKTKLSANLETWRVVRQLNLVLFICK